jgi:Flp pilus assembly protein TadD
MKEHRIRDDLVGTVVFVSIIIALAGCATTATTREERPQPSGAQTAAGGYRTLRLRRV